MPQGSVLGPILFLIYFAPLSKIIESHNIDGHGFADDTQMHEDFDLKSKDSLIEATRTIFVVLMSTIG